MRLLIITQKIDQNDPILGFFVRWVEEFAKHAESIIVICLEKGAYHFPDNVRVLSLGKERRAGRLAYLKNFYAYIWRERANYDSVFVHMNQEYVLLGGVLWRMWGKTVAFWYNHTVGTFFTRCAGVIAHKVFHTSPYAYTAAFKKAVRMPAGIDTNQFAPDPTVARDPRAILSLGRIAPVKHIDVLVEAARILDERGVDFVLNIYGAARDEDANYEKDVREKVNDLVKKNKVVFRGAISNPKTPAVYNTHAVSVNLTPAGNYDKTVLEALACGAAVVVSSKAFADTLPSEYRCKKGSSNDLANRLQPLLEHPTIRGTHQKELREYVVRTHGLNILARKIMELLA